MRRLWCLLSALHVDHYHDSSVGEELGDLPQGEHSQLQGEPCSE